MWRPGVGAATHLRNVDVNRTGRAGVLNATERAGVAPELIAREQLAAQGLGERWELVSDYKTERRAHGRTHGPAMHHVTLRQTVGGLECSNCLATCNIDARGRVLNMAYTAHLGAVPPLEPSVSPEQALRTVLELWGGELPRGVHATEKSATHATFPAHEGLSPDDVTVDLKVLALDHAEAQLTWRVYIETADPWYHMYEAWVQADPGRGAFGEATPSVLRVTDMVNWDDWGRPDPNRAGGALRGPAFRPRPNITRPSLEKKARAPVKRDSGTYEVYTIPDLDPGMGPRNLYTFVRAVSIHSFYREVSVGGVQCHRDDHVVQGDEPLERETSPLGWHSQGEDNDFTNTVGNNVCAQENQGNSNQRSCDDSIGFRPDGGAELDFRFGFDETQDPREQPTLSAAVTNLFWWHNVVHDIFQLNGFDEPAGNFQENNMGNGGLGDDSVQANAQVSI